MVVKRILLVCGLAGLMLAACACRPNIVGANAGVFSGGRLYAVASEDMTAVYGAAVKALGDLEMQITEKAKDVFSAKVIAKSADGKIIIVTIKPGTGDLTDFSIKVGTLGDEYRSQMIYDRIRQNLPAAGK